MGSLILYGVCDIPKTDEKNSPPPLPKPALHSTACVVTEGCLRLMDETVFFQPVALLSLALACDRDYAVDQKNV